MNRIAKLIAIPLLLGCALSANDRPIISSPVDGQKIGEERPIFKIRVEGRVPKDRHPFFAVEPMETSPKLWIQPEIHAVAGDGKVSGMVYLGERDHGGGEYFKIYLIGCTNRKALARTRTTLRVPKGCEVSVPVTVYRVQ